MIPDVSKKNLIEAMEDFDRQFNDSEKRMAWTNNTKYKYAIKNDQKIYPVKKIVSKATGLGLLEFNGGESPGSANRYVRERGLKVISIRSELNWLEEELILLLNTYQNNNNELPDSDSEIIVKLSDTLMELRDNMGYPSDLYDRSPDAVYEKLVYLINRNFETEQIVDTFKEIWDICKKSRKKCQIISDAIRTDIEKGVSDYIELSRDEEESVEAEEGRPFSRMHRSRERNQKIVKKKKERTLSLNGKLVCEVCGFDYKSVYGEHGKNFIECHHKKPISEIKHGETTKLEDLLLICANCHRMIHRSHPWKTPEELKKLLKRSKMKR